MDNSEKKKQILAAAGRIFSDKGFHQAKMDEIALEAGVAKGTLYYNFSSKSTLFSATVTEGLNRIMTAVDRSMESDLPFPEHFHSIVATLIRLYVANREVTRIYANEMSSGIDDRVLKEVKAVRQRFTDFLEENLKTGQEKGYLKPLSPRLSALAITGIVDTLAGHCLEQPDQDSLEEIIETVFSILSTGMVRSQNLMDAKQRAR
jgi:AcrR family transcriptional regulator